MSEIPTPTPNSPDVPAGKPKRRPRYRGTHPRHFHEKYKERDPARYGDEVAKVIASGKTPAGMHRSIMVREILEVLAPQPGEIAVDATLGYGGHATELWRAIQPGGRLVGLDVDPIELPKTEQRLRTLGLPDESLIIRRSNFAGLARVLGEAGIRGAHLVLADLGLSSMQIDDPARGFTFKRPGPLDLRLNPQRGQPASALLASLDAPGLARLLQENADEPNPGAMAAALVAANKQSPILTTTALADAVRVALGRGASQPARERADQSVRRVFQALRIEVNDEFGALDAFLRLLPGCLVPGGRVAVLTFHSGEDRRVKKAFQEGARAGVYARIADEVQRAAPDEVRANPRSSSAKLRWAVRS